MNRLRLRPAALQLLVLCLSAVAAAGCNSAGCNRDEPKVDRTKTMTTAEPIPSDFVLNAGFPEGKKLDIKLKGDAGGSPLGDGGSASGEPAGAQPAGTGAADPAAGDPAGADPAGEAGSFKVLSAGEGTRKELRYAFAVGKVETRSALVASSQDGPRGPVNGPPIKFGLSIGATSKLPSGNFLVDIRTTKIELQAESAQDKAAAAQLGAALAGAVGLGATLELNPLGALASEPKMLVPAGKGAALAAQLQPMLMEFIVTLFPRFPKEPVAPGAKWQTIVKQGATTLTQTFTLKSADATGGVIISELSSAGPKQPLDDPRAPPGTMVTAKAEAKSECAFLFASAPSKYLSENTSSQTVESGGKSQTMATRTKITLGN